MALAKVQSMTGNHNVGLVRRFAVPLMFAAMSFGVVFAPASHANLLVSTSDEKAALATKLAELLNSSYVVIGDDASDSRLKPVWAQIFASSKEFAELEQEYPGVLNELLDATLPIINRSATTRLALLQRRQAALYAEFLDSAELAFLVQFYRSPTGQKLLHLITKNMQTANVEEAAKSSGSLSIGMKPALADLEATFLQVIQMFDGDEKIAIEELRQSTAFAKMGNIGEQSLQNINQWHNEYLPGEEVEIDAAMEAVLSRRMDASE